MEARKVVGRSHFGQRANFVAHPAQCGFLIILENVVGELVGFGQLAAIDLRKLGEIELCVEAAGIKRGIGKEIAQPVGIGVVAAEQPTQRIEFEAARVRILEQREQLVMLALFGCRLGFGMMITSQRRIGRKNERQCSARSERGADEFHGYSPVICITGVQHNRDAIGKRVLLRMRHSARPAAIR